MISRQPPFTPKQAALHLHKLGANITAIGSGKNPTHEWNNRNAPWATERQPDAFVGSLKWPTVDQLVNGRRYEAVQTVGVICGVGDWRWFDVDAVRGADGTKIAVPDAVRDALLAALGLPADYPWCGHSKSGKGWHIAIRCAGELPAELAASVSEAKAADGGGAGVKIGTPAESFAGMFDHIELRWERCQTVLPTPNGYHGRIPTEPPVRVSIAQVVAAFYTVAAPKPTGRATPAQAAPARGKMPTERFNLDRAVRDLDRCFDLVAWFQAELGGETRDEPNGEVRLLGHTGLLIRPDTQSWVIHSTGVGGSWIKAVAHTRYGGVVPSGGDYIALVRTAAAFAGVTLHPEPQTTAQAAPQRPDFTHRAAPAAPAPAQAEAEDDGPEPWEPPLPLGRATEALPSFPTEALPAWLRAYVSAVAESTVTPPDMAALFGLAVIAAACQRRTRVQAKPDWVEPLCLYTFVVMPVGSRKTAVYNAMVQPVREYENTELAALMAQIEEDASQVKVLEGRLKEAHNRAIKAKSAQERQEAAQEIKEAVLEKTDFRPTVEPRYICADTTAEKLLDLMARHNGRMFLASDEAGIFATLGGRYSDGVANLDAVLQAHTEAYLSQDRITRTSVRVDRAALSLAVAGQPSVLQSLGANPEFKTRGLLARIIFSVPTVIVGGDDYPLDPPQIPPTASLTYARNVAALFARAARTQNNQGDDVADMLSCSTPALAALDAYRRVVRRGMVEGGAYDDGGYGWTAKLEGQVVRFAALVHMAEHGPEGVDVPIAEHSIAAAIQIGEYGYAHAKAAFGMIGADAGVEMARKVWRAIAQRGVMTITKREVHRFGIGGVKTVDDLDAPLSLLVRHGYLRAAPVAPAVGRGRKPSPVYEVNPLPSDRIDTIDRNSTGAAFAPVDVPERAISVNSVNSVSSPSTSTDAAPIAPDVLAFAREQLDKADTLIARLAAEGDTVDTDAAPDGLYWNEV